MLTTTEMLPTFTREVYEGILAAMETAPTDKGVDLSELAGLMDVNPYRLGGAVGKLVATGLAETTGRKTVRPIGFALEPTVDDSFDFATRISREAMAVFAAHEIGPDDCIPVYADRLFRDETRVELDTRTKANRALKTLDHVVAALSDLRPEGETKKERAQRKRRVIAAKKLATEIRTALGRAAESA